MATTDRIQQLHKTLNGVLAYKAKEMINRRDVWGSISFSAGEKEIHTIFELADAFQSMPLEYLSDQSAEVINAEFNKVLPQLKEIDTFTLTNGDPSNRCKNILAQIHNSSNNIYDRVAIWLPFLAYQKGDVSENIIKLASVINAAKQKMEEGVSQIEEKRKQSDDILVKAREAAANAGAAVFTQDFQREADSNRRNSWIWLFMTVIAGAFAVVLALRAYNDDYSLYQTALALWPKLACRFLLLSLCVTAAMWCGHIYKATRHLAIQNRHRALGLKTFQAFSAAATDLHTKDAVLLEATHCIFSNISTGLINESGTTESEPNVIQIAGKVMEHTATR